jgi:agmatinase
VFDSIEAHADHILDRGAMMLSLGGDHSVAYPLLKAHAKKHGPVALVQFDAHCDTWPDDGTRFDHGTMFARAAAEGIVDVKRSTQVGLRTYNSSDHGFEILTSPWVHRNGMDAAIDIVRDRAGDAPVYLSFDIDGLDPAFAPGTGTPVIGGLASWQGLEFVRGLEPLRLIGMDLVEVAPAYDHAEITAIAAASIAYDWMAVVAKQRGAVPHPVGRT